ncbi:hypothetical protein BH160DRAFT_2069 [Burkholderia sp. H160]|nr:hypothetical protein BH160DRAFT_2069 [Burkholderia sp. H160]
MGASDGILDTRSKGVEYCARTVERARAQNGEDLIGMAVNAHDDERKLFDDELVAMTDVLIILCVTALRTVAATRSVGNW